MKTEKRTPAEVQKDLSYARYNYFFLLAYGKKRDANVFKKQMENYEKELAEVDNEYQAPF